MQTKITTTEQLFEQSIYHQYSNEVFPLFNNTEYLKPSKTAHTHKRSSIPSTIINRYR